MITAIYARYSSDLQNERSIDDQIAACQEYAARCGIAGAFDVYADAALSGASMATRPQLLALMAAVRARRVSAVITEAIDRLSRDQADVHLIRRACTPRAAPETKSSSPNSPPISGSLFPSDRRPQPALRPALRPRSWN